MQETARTTEEKASAALDVVLTNAGAHSDAVASKLLELSGGKNGYPSLSCDDLVGEISRLLNPGLQAGRPLSEVAREQRETLTDLFRRQLPRALQFAAQDASATGLKLMFQGVGAHIQLSPADPAHAQPWQTENDSFDVLITRDGRSIEVLKEVRSLTGAGFARAKELMSTLPQVIKVGLSESEAENLERRFDRFGAEVELARRSKTATRSASARSAPVIPKLNLGVANDSLAAASAEVDPFVRLQRLRHVQRKAIRPTWQVYVDAVEAFANDVKASKEAHEASARAEATQAITSAEQRFSDKVADDNKQLEKFRNDGRALASETTQAAREIWNARGKGLELAEPEGEIARRKGNVVRGGIVRDAELQSARQDYDYAKSTASAFPAMQAFGDDKSVKNFLTGAGWSAGILFIVLWASTGFVVALLMAGLLFAGIMLIPIHTRSKAAEAYSALLDRVAALQGLMDANADKKASEVQSRIDSERQKLDAEKQEIAAGNDKKLQAIADKHAEHIKRGLNSFSVERENCRQLLVQLDEEIGRAVQERSISYGTLDKDTASATSDSITFPDRTRFRFGTDLAIPLPQPNAQAAQIFGERMGEMLVPRMRPPLFWSLSSKKSIFMADDQPASVGAEALISGLMSRILHQIPPGKVNFTLFDPIGLGRNFARFVKLADFSEQLINGRVWSDRDHMRRKLKDLIEHIETVTQKYLRNDFPDIETYNERAGEIAEPYRILVITDFAESFDEEAVRDLTRIVQNGPRCGVFAFIHANITQSLPHGVDLSVLRPFCLEMQRQNGSVRLNEALGASDATDKQPSMDSIAISVDATPDEDVVNDLVARFGGGAQKALRVEVPYQRLLTMAGISEESWWKSSSATGIEVPLGPTGAKKVQMIRLGSGLAHHSLIVGRPGSGKSNLIHVFISTIGRLYSPEEVQLYLIDFKKGVEFKCYAEAKLPHARVIAIESEREFGLSVLEGLDAELKSRGEKFRTNGSANIAEYRGKTGLKLPRIVLIVDEFQEFFTREDRIKRDATVLFDRLVRQGRAFGIHLLLGTQSLANAGLDRATQDQMAVRVALQCSEADSRLILGEDNTAARLLSRPGEAIYNDAAGLLEGNNLFQVALFSEDDRLRELAAISEASRVKKWSGEPPVVFEGHEPAVLADCRPLQTAVKTLPPLAPRPISLWLGEPTSLRPTIALPFKRQSGRNLLVLTRDEEQGVGVMLAGLLSIATQSPPAGARFAIIDLTAADAAWADHPEEFSAAVPHRAEVLGRRDTKSVIPEIEQEVRRRADAGLMKEPGIFLVLLGLQRARELRQPDGIDTSSLSMDLDSEEPTNLPRSLAHILREGPEVGVHTLIWCDTYANLDRALERASVNELGLRLAGPLAAQESHRLFDDEIASLIDKPHRMVKYDDDQVGAFELFRPYRVPDVSFIAEIGRELKERAAAT